MTKTTDIVRLHCAASQTANEASRFFEHNDGRDPLTCGDLFSRMATVYYRATSQPFESMGPGYSEWESGEDVYRTADRALRQAFGRDAFRRFRAHCDARVSRRWVYFNFGF